MLPQPVEHSTEAVFEHHSVSSRAGLARAVIVNPDASLRAVVEWSADELPRLYQWVLPTRARWALAIEPSTAALFGPDRDGPDGAGLEGGAPVLERGEARHHEVRITVGAGAARSGSGTAR